MNGSQLAILLLAVAMILTNINLALVKRQQAHFMDLIDAAFDSIGEIMKNQRDFCAELSDLLDLIKKYKNDTK